MVPKLVCTLKSPGGFRPLRGLSPTPRDCDLISLECGLGFTIFRVPRWFSCVGRFRYHWVGGWVFLPPPQLWGGRLYPHHLSHMVTMLCMPQNAKAFTMLWAHLCMKPVFLSLGSLLRGRKILSLHFPCSLNLEALTCWWSGFSGFSALKSIHWLCCLST